jgi:hypothetical protein
MLVGDNLAFHKLRPWMPTQTGPQVSSRSPKFKVIEANNMTFNMTPLEAAMSPELNLYGVTLSTPANL